VFPEVQNFFPSSTVQEWIALFHPQDGFASLSTFDGERHEFVLSCFGVPRVFPSDHDS
jgi:hypothetical protein